MNPYQPGEDNQDPYEVGYKASAASRDAEVVSLTNQRDYEYVRAENAEQERDQLRDQEKMLRDAIRSLLKAHRVTVSRSVPDTVMEAERILDLIRKAVAKAEEALAATLQ